jgi:hypothetical protein
MGARRMLPDMLRFERQLLASMVGHLDDDDRETVSTYVAGALAGLPEHLRLGVAAESLALGAWARVRPGIAHLAPLETSPLGPVRMYARLMRSLVLFAEQELRPGGGG